MCHFEHLPVVMCENIIHQLLMELVEEYGHGTFLANGSIEQFKPEVPSCDAVKSQCLPRNVIPRVVANSRVPDEDSNVV